MKNIKLKTGLKNKISIYVPSTTEGDKEVNNDFWVQTVREKLNYMFGGSTSFQSIGSWYNEEERKTITEEITIVYSYSQTLDNNQIDEVISLCEWLKEDMMQYCISLEINNSLHFI